MMNKVDLHPQITISTEIDCDRWNPPPLGCWKLNCDGSAQQSGRAAGCGGIMRDSSGSFVFAFSHRLEACTSIEAKLWGIYHGLSIAWSRGHKRIELESDSSVAIDLLFGGIVMDNLHHSLARGVLEVGGSALMNVEKGEQARECCG